jgi:hypothetical protein
MAYYVGAQEFTSLYDAIDYAALTNGTVTSAPTGMLTEAESAPAPTTDPYKIEDPYQTDGIVPSGMFNTGTTSTASGTSDMGINIDIDIPDIPSDINETLAESMFGQYGDRLYPYVYTARNDDLETGQSRGPLDGLSIEMLSAQDLYARFQQDNYAQRAFGSFENYIGYLDDLLNLAEEHPEINWWKDKAFRNLTAGTVATAEFYGIEPEDARSGSGALIDAFEAMLALPQFRQLVVDRGIETQFKLSSNDIYVFNGLTATEIHEGSDTFGAYFEQAMFLANRLGLAFMTGELGGAIQAAAATGQYGETMRQAAEFLDYLNSGGGVLTEAGAAEAASIFGDMSYAEMIAYLNEVNESLEDFRQQEGEIEDEGPSGPSGADDIYQILYNTIIGKQGLPEGVNSAILSAILGDFSEAGEEELRVLAQQIAQAGGWEAWAEANGIETSTTTEPTLLEQILADNPDITEEDVNVINSMIEAAGQAIPTSTQDAKDLIESIWRSVSSTAKDCETWTGSVPDPDGGDPYAGWKDCVNIGSIFAIPGLNLPIPPGMVDITWKDLEDKIVEAGESLEDFINDPTGWFEDKIQQARDKIAEVWGDITTGAIFTTDDLDGLLNDLLGGWIGGLIIDEIKSELEEANPLLFAGDCEDPAFREANEKYCAQAPLQCANGAINYPECNQCPEGFVFSAQTQRCEPAKQAPIGPTAEECAQQNRSHIPAEEGGTSRCGGCLSGYEPNTEGECVEESVEGPCKIPGQVRNEVTGQCEDPVVFEPGAPCKNDLGVDGTYDEEGNCVIRIEPEPEPEPDDGCPEGQVRNEVTGECVDEFPGTEAEPEPEPEPEVEVEPEPEPEPEIEVEPEPEPSEETCANGAVDWPLCSECADDTKPSDYEDGQCPGPVGGEPGEPTVEGGPIGGGGGGGSRGGSPFMARLDYQVPGLLPIIAPPNVDYSAGLLSQPPQMKDYNQALGGVIANSLQKRKKGMLV